MQNQSGFAIKFNSHYSTMSKRIIILASFIVLSIFQTFGQVGREFWFVAPEVTSSHGDKPVVFRITAFDERAKVELSFPANTSFGTIKRTIEPNTQGEIEIDNRNTLNNFENFPSNRINNKGVLITSDSDITVYYEVANGVNPDKFTLKGDNGLGTEFYIPSQNFLYNHDSHPLLMKKLTLWLRKTIQRFRLNHLWMLLGILRRYRIQSL